MLAAPPVSDSASAVDILGEGFHLAVRMGPLQSSSSLAATRLMSVPLRVLAGPILLRTMGPISSPTDLPLTDCLRLSNRRSIICRPSSSIPFSS
jgi:DNA-binding transcriptional LysR family regulator